MKKIILLLALLLASIAGIIISSWFHSIPFIISSVVVMFYAAIRTADAFDHYDTLND